MKETKHRNVVYYKQKGKAAEKLWLFFCAVTLSPTLHFPTEQQYSSVLL